MRKNAIRESARGETCTFLIPGICNGNTETTVYCHAPHPDRGTGYKSHPAAERWGAYGCSACHDVMDGRRGLRADNYAGYWLLAIRETQRRLIAKGLLK